MLRYTIGFIIRGEEILMLNRNAEPGMGRWNGVGGKIEQGESPLDCIIRETYEETGIQLQEEIVNYAGVVTWRNDYETSGMYTFIADVPMNFSYPTPNETAEGILSWKQKDWLFNPKNLGVLSHVPHFLPTMMKEKELYEHRFVFSKGVLLDYQRYSLDTKYIF